MATAVPNAASGLGDDQGPYLGQVVGSSRSGVMFDPTHGPMHPELNKSGLSVFVAGLGGGKSVGFGAIAESSARRGHRTVVMDPSGPLSALTRLPHLRRHSRHVDLTGAEVGTLNPYRLVPVPLRSNYDTDREYEDAIRESEAERRDLMIDTAWMLLPSQRPDHYGRITQAVGETPAEYGVNPWQFVHRLRRQGEAGAEVATMLEQVSLLKGGLLIFPDTDADQTHRDDVEDAVLNVITMPGLTTPAPGSDPKHWTRAERMSVPMLHLAARYASRVMYADREPKVIGTDEGGIAAAAGSSFKSFALRGSRDSRKHNTYFGLLMQNPSDALEVSDEIDNLLGTAFIGRVTGEGPIAAALKLLGVPRGCGYEKVLPNLEPGEFVMRDYYGRVDKMRVDLGHRPELLAALKTTPPSARVRVVDNTTPYEVGGRR